MGARSGVEEGERNDRRLGGWVVLAFEHPSKVEELGGTVGMRSGHGHGAQERRGKS